MAISNLYSNLPAHLVEFKDGGLQYTIEEDISTKKSLLILGTALDGPVNEPVKIDKTTVSLLFGPEVNEKGFSNGTTLTKYAKQAFKNGFGDVRCMRVTGSQAYVDLIKESDSSSEDVETKAYATIPGNSSQESLVLGHRPFVGSSLNVMTEPDGKGTKVSTSSYNIYDGVISIGAGLVPAKSTVYATYDYQTFSTEQTLAAQAVSSDSVTFDASITLFDPSSRESIYVTDAALSSVSDESLAAMGIPKTTGEIVTVDGSGAVLVKGVDYDITGGVLTIIPSTTAVTYTDTITIKYYICTLTSATETITFTDPDFTIKLDNTPKSGSAIVVKDFLTSATIDPSYYSVAGDNITFYAGNFGNNQEIEVDYVYEKITTAIEGITVRSIYGGSIYKEAKITVSSITNDAGEEGRRFTFTKPESKKISGADGPFYFDSFDCPTVGILKEALRNYVYNNVFEIVTDNDDMDTSTFPLFSGNLSEGGDDGVNPTNNEMFEALSGKRNSEGYLIKQGAYQILENYNVDYIYPAGVYADSEQTVNPHSNFHQELCLVCAVLTYRTKMTHGFIDVKPNYNTTLVGVQKYVDKLLNYENIHYMTDSDGNVLTDKNGDKMDIGWYTSVVAGPDPVIVSDTLGKYYGSAAIAYAALCGSLKPESAPTNKALLGVKGIKYKFSNKQMNDLVGNRMVVFKLKNEGITTASSAPYVVDGCTAGAPNCDYARITTVKVVTDVVDQIREVCDPFLGESNTVEQRNAMSSQISKRLSKLMNDGEILYYAFDVIATIEQVLLGECSISLTLAVPQELRKITTVVALKAAV